MTCYQPVQLPVHEEYRCGNVACIKVLDPAHDIAKLAGLVSEALYFGIGVAACFGLCFHCLMRQASWSCRDLCVMDEWGSADATEVQMLETG